MQQVTPMDILKRQHTVISYLITYASRAREVVNRAAINADMFPDPDCRATFLALLADAAEDDTLLLELAQNTLPALKDFDSMNSILALSANSAALEYEVMEFAKNAIIRQQQEDMRDAVMRAVNLPPEVLISRQKEILASTEAKIAALVAAFPTFQSAAGTQNAAAEDDEFPTTDPALLDMPGFVNELTEYSMRAAHHPNRVLSFTGALAMLAHLAGRKYIGPQDSKPNIYVVALAESGAGKNFPQRINRKIASLERIDISIVSSIASGQGLEDAMLRSPTLLCQIDEIDTLLEVMKDTKASKQATEALWKLLLNIFTETGSPYNTRAKAAGPRGNDSGMVIHSPYVSIYGSAVPDRFYSSLNERACTSGFLGRCLIFEAGTRGEFNPDSGEMSNSMPQSLRQMISYLANIGVRLTDNRPVEIRDVIRVPYGEGAADEMKRVAKEVDKLSTKASREKDAVKSSVLNRYAELVGKLALLYAISESLGSRNQPVVSLQAVKWACRLVDSLQSRMLAMVEEYTVFDEMDEKVKKVERMIRQAGKRGISRQVLLRKTHLLSDVLDRIENTLIDRGTITVNALTSSRNGKASKQYIIVRGKQERI